MVRFSPSVMLYLLTIAPIKWLGFRQFDNANPRDPAFYDDPSAARAWGRPIFNGIETFPFLRGSRLLAEFPTRRRISSTNWLCCS